MQPTELGAMGKGMVNMSIAQEMIAYVSKELVLNIAYTHIASAGSTRTQDSLVK